MRVALLTVALASLWPANVLADIYRCTRPGGEVHFTNVRPTGPQAGRCQRIARSRPVVRTDAAQSTQRRSLRDRSPDRHRRYDRHIREAARLYQLPESFIRAVVRVESDFSPRVVSAVGAMGLMQLMPRTAASMGVRDPFDPRQNILGGTRFLRVLANKFNGDLVLTIAAYNAGPGAVRRHRGVPPYAETRRYVRNVLEHYYAFRAAQNRVVASR